MAQPQPQAMAQAAPQPQAQVQAPSPAPAPQVSKPVPQPQPAAVVPQAEAIERAVVREDAFIPPKPVEPQTRPTTVTAPVVKPDPFAAAAMANGGHAQAPYKVRTPSLFERVTGVGRSRPADPVVTKTPPAPAATPSQPAAPAQPQQPRLGPLDPSDRVTVSKGEEDLLEIPAFLRRQAN
jgi:cell division protein FtsZ